MDKVRAVRFNGGFAAAKVVSSCIEHAVIALTSMYADTHTHTHTHTHNFAQGHREARACVCVCVTCVYVSHLCVCMCVTCVYVCVTLTAH